MTDTTLDLIHHDDDSWTLRLDRPGVAAVTIPINPRALIQQIADETGVAVAFPDETESTQ